MRPDLPDATLRSGAQAGVEWDQVFNDYPEKGWTWGDAAVNPTFMDFRNIATHEMGHSFGLGHSTLSYAEETMYPYASPGETKKRDLNSGDIAGINKLY
jgi:hypothetical protein